MEGVARLNHVTHGDGLEGLLSLAPGSVDLVLSDLPSGETAAPFDKRPDIGKLWMAINWALKVDGLAVLMASSLRFASELRESQVDRFRYDMIWEKTLPTGHYNSSGRPLRSHEFILVFWREGGVFHPQMQRGVVPISSNRRRLDQNLKSNHGVNYGTGSRASKSRAGELDRFPNSVLHFGSVANNTPGRHPQEKPDDMMAYLIRSYSNPGDLVVDPYSGSASTGRAAIDEGRRFLGWDTDETFVRLGNERLGQMSLLGLEGAAQ